MHGWFRQQASGCGHCSSVRVLLPRAQLLSNRSPSAPRVVSHFLPAFPVWGFIFCCNIYKPFLHVSSSKADVENVPPYLHCCTSLHAECEGFRRTRVCVPSSFIPVWPCMAAEHSHTLMRQLTKIKELSSLLCRPSASIPRLGWLLWMWSWTEGELLGPGGPRAGFVKVISRGLERWLSG